MKKDNNLVLICNIYLIQIFILVSNTNSQKEVAET